ncbi:hypothetical protein MMC16_000793 [Acarospora aff. strigata]|nr:hypothetical protein [Acarospora aff. strigata]
MEEEVSSAEAPLMRQDSVDVQNDDDIGDLREQDLTSPSWFIWALTFSAGISGLLFGYDTGVISSTLVSIGSDLSYRPLDTLDKSLITSSTSLFALIASLVASVLADRLGRKRVILVADGLFILGAIWQALTTSIWGMIGGRSIVGLAIGAASLVVPLYISELSPAPFRDGGVRYWMDAVDHSSWVEMDETPRWLVKANKRDDAKLLLGKLYGTHFAASKMVDRILRAIEREMVEEEEMSSKRRAYITPAKGSWPWLTGLQGAWTELFAVGGNRRALTIACMLQGFQQLCGFNSLMYFSATIFALVGFDAPTLASLSIAFTNFLLTVVAFNLIDRIGRRRILLLSIPVMITGLALCALAFNFIQLPIQRGEVVMESKNNGVTLWAFLILASMVVAFSRIWISDFDELG